jgi:hypothetical protein
MGVAGGGNAGAEMTAPRGGTDQGADGARRSPLAMPIGNAAEGVGAANRAAVPNRGHDEIHRVDPECGLVPAAASGARGLDQRGGWDWRTGVAATGQPPGASGVPPWSEPTLATLAAEACRRPCARVTPSDACGLGRASGAATPASPSSQAKRPGCHDGEAPAVRKPPGSSQAQTSAPLACSGVSAPALPGPKEPPHPRGITQA